MVLPQMAGINVGSGQYHLAVAGGSTVGISHAGHLPTRYREVVLTRSKFDY